MAATISSISFGRKRIPFFPLTATQDNNVCFNRLHKSGNDRYKKTRGHCGKKISAFYILKGFEYDKDQYVIDRMKALQKSIEQQKPATGKAVGEYEIPWE